MVKPTLLILVTLLVLCSLSCNNEEDSAEIPDHFPEPEITFDLNTVTFEELISIDGIKKNVAREIVLFRKSIRFKRVEDLLAVKGIGEKTFYRTRRFFFVK